MCGPHGYSSPCLGSQAWRAGPSCTLVEACSTRPWPFALDANLMAHIIPLILWRVEHEPEPGLTLEEPLVKWEGLSPCINWAKLDCAPLSHCSLRIQGRPLSLLTGLRRDGLPRGGTTEPGFNGKEWRVRESQVVNDLSKGPEKGV